MPIPVLPGSLAAALRSAARPTAWGPMDDPVAQQLLAGSPSTLGTLADVLATHGLGPSGVPLAPLDGGVGSVVLAAGDRVVRLGYGPSVPRPNVPEVLQPLARGQVGAVRYEVLPRLITQNVSDAVVRTLAQALAQRGYRWTDVGPDNVGLDPSDPSRAWVLDPGGVDPEPGTPVPSVPVVATAADDLAGVGEWLRTAPEDLVLVQGWLAVALLTVQVQQALASYPHFPGDASRTRRVQRALKNGEPWRPVYVERGDPSLFVLEGRHRMVAYTNLGMAEIPVVYAARPDEPRPAPGPDVDEPPSVAPSVRRR